MCYIGTFLEDSRVDTSTMSFKCLLSVVTPDNLNSLLSFLSDKNAAVKSTEISAGPLSAPERLGWLKRSAADEKLKL